MFLNIVKADGQAEQQVIREMKARAAGARGDIEQIVRGVMADVQQRGWDAVVEYAERFDGKARSDRARAFARRHLCAGRHSGVSVECADERHSGQGCRCR